MAGRMEWARRPRGAGVLGAALVLGLIAPSTAAVTTAVAAGPERATPVGAAAAEAAAPDVVFDGEAGTVTGASESVNATVTGVAARNGSGGLHLNAQEEGSFVRWGTDVVPQGRAYASVQAWIRVLGRGPAQSVDLLTIGNTQRTANFDFFVNQDTQRFQWDIYRDDWDETDFAVEYGRWYLFEALVEFDGRAHTAQVRIDGQPQGTITSTGTDLDVRMMIVGAHELKTHSQHYDDIELRVGHEAFAWPIVDDTDPTVELHTPAMGARYARGSAPRARYDCVDAGGSGLAAGGCTGTVADGERIDTGTPGRHQFTVTATDGAGNTTQVTREYVVARNRPDTLIRPRSVLRFQGGSVYSADGSGQTVWARVRRGGTKTFFVRVENDGTATDSFRLRGVRSDPRWRIRYFTGRRDITGVVTNGSFWMRRLAPGQGRVIRVVVRPTSRAGPRAYRAVSVTSFARTDRQVRDTVRAVVRRA